MKRYSHKNSETSVLVSLFLGNNYFQTIKPHKLQTESRPPTARQQMVCCRICFREEAANGIEISAKHLTAWKIFALAYKRKVLVNITRTVMLVFFAQNL